MKKKFVLKRVGRLKMISLVINDVEKGQIFEQMAEKLMILIYRKGLARCWESFNSRTIKVLQN